MCGIVGAVGSLNSKEDVMVKLMLQLDVIRGKDSTGLVAVDKKGKWTIAKEAWLPQDLLEHRAAKEIFKSFDNYIYIGHNRAATVGAVNKAGAHPFEFEHVVGVHNGTTPKHPFVNGNNYDVDSQALYDHLNEKGVEDMWKNVQGAASLAFFDKRTKQFHLLRNKERPMCFAFNKTGSVMYFASEAWMIQVAAARAKVDLNEEYGIKSTDVDKLYSFEPFTHGGVCKFKTREVKPYTRPTTQFATVLNTWAVDLHGMRPNQEVHFKVISSQKGTQNQTIFNVETTSTKKPIRGRVYCYTPAHKDLVDMFSAPFADEEFCGDVVSVTTFGANKGFTLKASSCFSLLAMEEFLNGKKTEAEGLVIDGVDGIITREEFQNPHQFHAECVCCSDPLSYDDPSFKFAGIAAGKRQFVCDSCQDIAQNLFPSVTLRDVNSIKELTH